MTASRREKMENMSRPPRARESVLDAFEALLIAEGPKAATMDAAAQAAGVSKGGLLYHFASKEALETALLERMEQLAREDVAEMEAEPEGIVSAFLRSSVMDDSPIDRALIARAGEIAAASADAGGGRISVRIVDVATPAVPVR